MVVGGDVFSLQKTKINNPLLLFHGTCCGLILNSVSKVYKVLFHGHYIMWKLK